MGSRCLCLPERVNLNSNSDTGSSRTDSDADSKASRTDGYTNPKASRTDGYTNPKASRTDGYTNAEGSNPNTDSGSGGRVGGTQKTEETQET